MTVVVAAVVDAVLTLVFAIVGRSSHDEALDAAGVLGTWWPFLVALAIAWVVTLSWRRPLSPLWTGVPVWVVTVAGGMLLRAASGAGTAPAFVVVATVVLCVLLVGWRAAVALLSRLLRRRGDTPTER